jgi:shikimate kinase
MPAERLILIGSRGSGKSTVGELLAQRLGWRFADTDAAIEAAAGRSIADIFATEQEAGFRNRETAVLQELCQEPKLVLATGGGAVLRPSNRALLRSAGFVVWLQVSAEVAWARLQADPTTAARRPNLTATGGLEEVRTLLTAREPLYREMADFTIRTDRPSPEAVATAILLAWAG